MNEISSRGLNTKKISISLDHARYYKKIVLYVWVRLFTITIEDELFHLHCCVHILYLVVEDDLLLIENSIERTIKKNILTIVSSLARNLII